MTPEIIPLALTAFCKTLVRNHLCLALVVFWVSPLHAAGSQKTSVLVPLDDEPSWRDMAYLAAVPASEIANGSGASLLALGHATGIGPEFRDYARRYQPGKAYLLGHTGKSLDPASFLPDPGAGFITLPAETAEEAATELSRTFWQESKNVVICQDDDYDSALLAAPLAALLQAPLLYSSASGISPATQAEIKRLGATRVVSVGPESRKAEENTVALAGAIEVMKWAKEQGFEVNYLAAVNPLDRTRSKVRKLSMIGSQLAAGRKGLVAPLCYQVEWKKPSKSQLPDHELPTEFQDQKPPARVGTLQAGSNSVPYVLSGKPDDSNLALFFDKDGAGKFNGPIHTGDEIELDGRTWTVSLGAGSSYHDADVHITWPTVDVLTGQLKEYHKALGHVPSYLCLVGLPDAIPQALVRGKTLSSDLASDLPFAMIENQTSSQIAVGRVVAEDISFGTLYAARVLTYPELLNPEWADKACQAEWENSFGPLFANAGFDASYHLTDEDIPWSVPPSKGKKGKKALSFAQDSPLARTKLLAHMNHSWNFELGSMMKWDATVLLAPTIVESGGCGTASLDRGAPGQAVVEGATGARSPELATKHRSVVSRLFRLGAVSFSGGSREMMAENLPFRQEFWNGVLAGESVGESHRRAQNTGHLILKELGKKHKSYAYFHTLYANTLLGDPALSIQLPGQPLSAPARTEVSGDRVTVHAPEKWTTVKLFVPPDWKKWANRDLFVTRGAGAYSLSSWGPEERDVETPMVKAEFTSDKKIKGISMLSKPTQPLGWSGTWHTNRNRDGSYTHRFGVRMLDYDQEKGTIRHSVDKLEFAVVFE